ncbi:MAG: Ni/Fe hydrogenase subunit alpha [Candidatus Kryptoniota bacterium]
MKNNKTNPQRLTIKVDYLARVEGEGSMFVRVKDGEVSDFKFKIFEPPRFFEAFLRGRRYSEAPDITARICGICPIAYQMSSVHAMESVFGIHVDEQVRQLRRLLYCGEWIESHALHIYMLHAPDFLGMEDAIQLSRANPQLVQEGLKLKKAGNELVSILGGREIHPVSVRVGGFYKVPERSDLAGVRDQLLWAREAAYKTVRMVSTFSFPELERDYEFVSLRHPNDYPMNEGRLISNKGLDIDIREYELVFQEKQVPHSNALQSILKGHGDYLVGPLARFNLNFDRLSSLAKAAAEEVGFIPPVKNPFKSIIARAVEILYACDEAIRIIDTYEKPEKPFVDFRVQPGFGFGCTEAPRGILYHRYQIGDDGLIKDAKIVPPTSQNQACIEHDLKEFVTANLQLPKEELTWKCEQVIRNYDPCISCATHFLKVDIRNETTR